MALARRDAFCYDASTMPQPDPAGRSAAIPVYRQARVLTAREAAPGYLELLLSDELIPAMARPGQFVMVRGWKGSDPMLPRAFDIAEVDPEAGAFRLFIKIEGRGTGLLGRLKPGEAAAVLGPLGRPLEDWNCRSMALLTRGVGAAAVIMLAREAARRGIRVHTILSAARAGRLVCREQLEPFSDELSVCTDDGSAGYHGNGTELLDRLVEQGRAERAYTCGSKRFARHVQKLDSAGRLAGYVFMEGAMACGIGDCHGCVVARAGGQGYWQVCTDGPVFRAGEVVLP